MIISILIIAIIKGWKRVVFGFAFYFFTIALVLQFIPVGSAIVAERYTYLPYLGLSFIVGESFQRLWNKGYKVFIIILILFICYKFTAKTRIQCDVWENHVTLFRQAVKIYPNDPFSRKTLASGLWANKNLDEAIYHTEYAINELGLITSSAFELLANCYSEKGEVEKSIAFFNEAVRLDSSNVTARYHRGLALLEINHDIAIIDFNFCEDSNNEYVKPLIYSPRGRAYALTKQYHNALSDLDKAIEYFPKDINNYKDKAITLEKLNRIKESKMFYQKVLTLNPNESYALERLTILQDPQQLH